MNWPQIVIICLMCLKAIGTIVKLGRGDPELTSGQQVFGGVLVFLFWFGVAYVLQQGGFW